MINNQKPIYVTQPYMPPLEEFTPLLETIWESKILTNCGPLHQELEEKLCDHLNVPYISLFNNCTIGLMSTFPILKLQGEVITTPFTFIATANSLMWNNLKPVFVDIDPITLNLDPNKIEQAITPKTSAILAVHCYGRPCETQAIKDIADKHGLKIIYDSAHVFGVEDHHGGIARHGDLSVLSFHATKVFNTFEGGAIISHSKSMKDEIDQFKNFGINSESTINAIGLNGKMSEINAAMGLLQLKYVDDAIQKRKRIYDIYHAELNHIDGIILPDFSTFTLSNYSYFPIIVESRFRLSRDELCQHMNAHNIFPRKYFYPMVSDFKPYKNFKTDCPVSKDRSEKILCLPIYPAMDDQDIERIVNSLKSL